MSGCRLAAAVSLLVVAAVPAAAELVFIRGTDFATPAVVDRHGLGPHTLVRTPDALILVDWSRPRWDRATEHPVGPLAVGGVRSRFVALGDTLVALREFGQGDHVLAHLDPQGELVVEFVADPDWLPAHTVLAGKPYFVDCRANRALFWPALGAPGERITVTHDEVGAGFRADFSWCGGRRLVFGARTDERGEHGLLQVWDVSDPARPVAGAVVELEWELLGAAIDGDIGYFAAGTLQSWDLSDVQAPVFLDQVGPAGTAMHVDLGPEARLAYALNDEVKVLDVADPADLRIRDSWVDHDPRERLQSVSLERTRVVRGHGAGLRQVTLPAGNYGHMQDGGLAWPVVAWDAVLASDGRRFWSQEEGRLAGDLVTGEFRPAAEATQPIPHLAGAFARALAVHAGHLFYAPGDGRLVVEDVRDPWRPVLVREISPPDGVWGISRSGDRLAIRSGAMIMVLDIGDPAQPGFVGAMEIGAWAGHALYELHGDLLLVVEGHAGTWESDEWLRVFALGRPTGMTEVAAVRIAEVREYTHVSRMYCLESEIYFGVWDAAAWRMYDLSYDLSDPAHPVLASRGGDLSDDSSTFRPRLRHRDDLFLLSVEDHVLTAREYVGTMPTPAPPAATLALDAPFRIVAAAGDRVLLEGDARYRAYRFTPEPVSGVGTPRVPAALRIAPNPFNARTTIAFAMEAAGAAVVEIFDVRGRRLDVLRIPLPRGPAALTWDGRDARGRDVAGGIYLVRVTTSTSTLQGRCALVR